VRGGGECGRAWHEAAVRRAKATSVSDLEACADWLAAAGLAAPGCVVLRGASAGGLAAGAALVRRPKRYGAAVLQARVGPACDCFCCGAVAAAGARG
jgi:prolyl oligopeptidase PreP (S9A serine peptidase family)